MTANEYAELKYLLGTIEGFMACEFPAECALFDTLSTINQSLDKIFAKGNCE